MTRSGINIRLYLFLFGIVLVAGAWKGGEWITTTRLASLVVLQAPKVDIGGTTINAKSFYPAWVKQAVVVPNVADDDTSVDELFRRKAAQEAPPAATPNYLDIFRQNARIDGITDSGVFVNGRFYRAKEKLEPLAIQGVSGDTIIPVVESVSKTRIVFRVGRETVTVTQR